MNSKPQYHFSNEQCPAVFCRKAPVTNSARGFLQKSPRIYRNCGTVLKNKEPKTFFRCDEQWKVLAIPEIAKQPSRVRHICRKVPALPKNCKAVLLSKTSSQKRPHVSKKNAKRSFGTTEKFPPEKLNPPLRNTKVFLQIASTELPTLSPREVDLQFLKCNQHVCLRNFATIVNLLWVL